jgi:transcriptional regulator with XRE-family HTH domain
VPETRRLYIGPSLRRLRRDRGLTQADMAADLGVSPSYIALIERNQRPLTAEVLVRLAQTYDLDVSTLTSDGAAGERARLDAALKHPIFADIELAPLETGDISTNFPGFSEAFLRLFTA